MSGLLLAAGLVLLFNWFDKHGWPWESEGGPVERLHFRRDPFRR